MLVSVVALVPVAQADPAGPLPPLALTADSTDGDRMLSWEASLGEVDGYRVYRADDLQAVLDHGLDAFSVIGETTALNFVDPSGPATESNEEGRALYFVTALLGDDESGPSNPVGMYPHCWRLTELGCWIP